jgi:hypothetical protein
LEEPLTVAANRWVAAVSREAELGLMLIDTGRGTGGGGLPPALPPPQANINAIGMIIKTIAHHVLAFLLEGFRSKPSSKIPVIPRESGMTNRRWVDVLAVGLDSAVEIVRVTFVAPLLVPTDGGLNEHDACAGRLEQENVTGCWKLPPTGVTFKL